ncbi:MAG: TPM domain-containing protein, partial [Bdellovibrionota bacterium]
DPAKPIPAPPYYYVLDEAGVMDARSLQALQALLIEHDRTTGEQIVMAIFKSLDGEDLVDYTNRVFSQWKIGQRGKDNGVLLALYWNDHKSRFEVGYGLEGLLTDAKTKDILENVLKPELQAGNPNRALSLAALEILRTVGSPLIANGRAEEILRSGGFRGRYRPVPRGPSANGWFVWVFLGIILISIVMNLITAAEAHFTSAGWYRPRPWDRNRRLGGRGGGFWWGGGGWGGGGGGGGWGGGDGGGFSGGGGSSGGGGASGSW